MLSAMGVIVVGLAIFFWEGTRIWKQKKKREMAVFSSSLLIAVALSIGVVLHIPIPSPTEMIGKLLAPIVNPIVLWTKGEAS